MRCPTFRDAFGTFADLSFLQQSVEHRLRRRRRPSSEDTFCHFSVVLLQVESLQLQVVYPVPGYGWDERAASTLLRHFERRGASG